MASSRNDIARELEIKVSKDLGVRRKAAAFAEEVAEHVRKEWDEAGPHPYAVGDFRESIHLEKKRDRGRWPSWRVISNHPNANMIEFGTGWDKPDSKSPWGPYTDTPEFAPFGKTAHHYGGTSP